MLRLSILKSSHKFFIESKGFRGYPLTSCLCGITKAMLAGILHSGFLLVVFSQPEKKKPVDFCKVVETVAL